MVIITPEHFGQVSRNGIDPDCVPWGAAHRAIAGNPAKQIMARANPPLIAAAEVPESHSLAWVNMDPYRLERFVEAQEGVYDRALTELRAGRKARHWMWFVFPQVAGLGSSPMSQRYAIGSLEEARAYLGHPVLGSRLVDCSHALLSHPERTARQIMGSPDDVKLRSSMTLFALAAGAEPVFQRVLDVFFDGKRDQRTAALLDG